MKRASVIILSWNGETYLPDCLNAVMAQSHAPHEVILVDNASTDGSVELVAANFPQVRIICNDENLGFAGGMNVGLKEATGDIAVLLNQDTVVREDWLAELVKAMETDKHVGIAGCKILYPDGQTIQHAGGYLEYPLGLAHHYGYGEPDQGQWDEQREVEYVTGAAMAIQREMLERIGYLDDDFFPAYFEDADICIRARQAGYKVVFVPTAVLVHHESASTEAETVEQHYYYHRNRLRLLFKHYTLEQFKRDFLPTEKERFALPLPLDEVRALRRSYLEKLLPPSFLAGRLLLDRGGDRQQWWGALSELRKSIVHQHSADYLPSSRAQHLDELKGMWKIEERPFVSDKPIVGPLIARIRELWNSVAAKWFVRAQMQQQMMFNLTVVRTLTDFMALMDEIQAQARDADQDSALLAERLVELGEQISDELHAISERLGRLESRLK
jgi:GT2 family glycosyltransferase